MTVEYDAVYIADLDPALPEDSDDISEGASHIRLVKQDLQNTFPNIIDAMTVSDAYLNDLDDALTFGNEDTSDDNTTQVYYASINNRRLKGGLEGREGSDFAILSQVQDMINQALSEGIFPIGSFFTTSTSDNPADVLGFGTWTQVSGMLFGSGSYLSMDGKTSRTFTLGETGGTIDKYIKATNIPEMDIDTAAVDSNNKPYLSISATGDLSNITQGFTTARADANTHDSGGELLRRNNNGSESKDVTQPAWLNGSVPVTATLSGVIPFGEGVDTLETLDVMNPYNVVNIWKRTA